MAKEITAYFTGPVLYANVLPHNAKTKEDKYTPKGGETTIMLGLDEEDAEQVIMWNEKYVGKDRKYYERKAKKAKKDIDDVLPDGFVDGLAYFTFRRGIKIHDKDGEFNEKATEYNGGFPTIFDAKGDDWDTSVNIGNGSICTLKLKVFINTNAAGDEYSRVTLEGIRVDEHVPYEGKGEVERETLNRSGDEIPF